VICPTPHPGSCHDGAAVGAVLRKSRRHRRALVLLLAVGIAVPLPVAAHLAPLPGLRHSGSLAAADRLLAPDDGALLLTERGYRLALEPSTGRVTVATVAGREYIDFPLAMTAGARRPPPHSRRVARRSGGQFESRLLDAGGRVLQEVVLAPSPDSFVVRFAARPELLGGGSPRFFHDSAGGLDLAEVTAGYTPDPARPASGALPVTGISGRTPFAPPPFQIQLGTRPGWVGIGLVEVPSATTMRLTAGGGVGVDYPPALMSGGGDLGAGPPLDGMVRFPQFVVTLAADPLRGLRAYHDALSAGGWSASAAPPGSRPAWWSRPLVDTWGEQMATGSARTSPRYTADWVRQFVAEWRRRFGAGPVTVIVDSRWQARIGDPQPDPVRFGGLQGMRQLVDQLHAQGDRVLLWWPMWARNVVRFPPATNAFRGGAPAGQVVDPTGPLFEESTRRAMGTLLGSGPGQLDADGVKLDWCYDIPLRLADPGTGWGATALYRYLAVLHSAAHAVRPDALVDASAAAPQFAAVTDAVRLYDAWSEADWNRRAAVVSAADPDTLIDGDGFQATAANLVAHAVDSTVYGTPAVYFGTRLMDGRPITPALAAEVGTLVALSPDKGQGRPRWLGGGDWEYVTGSAWRARSFAGGTGLVVWRSAACGTAVATPGGRVTLPLRAAAGTVVRDPRGRPVPAQRIAAGLSVVMVAGRPYALQRPGASC
jgi:hypothetical protein